MPKAKIPLSRVLIVEGRYDKNKVSQIFDAIVLETGGFSLFSESERMGLIRRMAETRGIVILTDSDHAGQLIRNRIKGQVQSGEVFHAYVPDLYGKERRKSKASREGKLGVEGMPDELIVQAVRRSGAMDGEMKPTCAIKISRGDLFALGLSGRPGSAERRRALLKRLSLPEAIATPALADVLNALISPEELAALVREIEKEA